MKQQELTAGHSFIAIQSFNKRERDRERNDIIMTTAQRLLLCSLLGLILVLQEQSTVAFSVQRSAAGQRRAQSKHESLIVLHDKIQPEQDEDDPDYDEDIAKLFTDNDWTNDPSGDMEMYNEAPVVTGVIVTAFTTFLAGYGIYAGLTENDPLFQQY